MLYHCFASFKQSLLDFFKLVDSRFTLMLTYDSLNLIISGVHQSHLSCWGHRSEKAKLRTRHSATCFGTHLAITIPAMVSGRLGAMPRIEVFPDQSWREFRGRPRSAKIL